MRYHVKPSILQGSITIPPSKSHTLRAILFASLANGVSSIRNYLRSPDTTAMIAACQAMGAEIKINNDELMIRGTAGQPRTPKNIIDAGNSGQVLRFIAAIAALTPGFTIITGDHSITHNRPMQPLLEGLAQLGALAVSTKGDGCAPVIIKGPIQSGHTTLSGEDSQPVSALLIAAAHLNGQTQIEVTNPGEKPWIELTLAWLKRVGVICQHENYTHYRINGGAQYAGFDYTVPGDFGSAAFPIAAALITGSELTLHSLDMQDVQGDKAFIHILQEMGAQIEVEAEKKLVHIKKTNYLQGKEININDLIDALPILAVLACFAKGKTRITGAAIARKKESNRLQAMTQELQKMGANIIEEEDGLLIAQSELSGVSLLSHHDHRIALALTVAGFAASGETVIEETACVAKSYPDFVRDMQAAGAIMAARAS